MPRGPKPTRCAVAAKTVVRAMRENGIPVAAVAARLGVTHQAVSARLKAGLTPERERRYLLALTDIICDGPVPINRPAPEERSRIARKAAHARWARREPLTKETDQ